MERSFSLPCNSQTSSPLLSLPFELRYKIFRQLLKTSDFIGKPKALRWRARAQTQTVDLELSAQLLSCCQILLQEGSEILYCENALYIDCSGIQRHNLDFITLNLTIYGAQLSIWAKPAAIDPSEDLYQIASDWIKYDWLVDHYRIPLERFLRMYDVLNHFQLVYIESFIENAAAVYVACRVLRNFLKGKDVAIELSPNRYVPYSNKACEAREQTECLQSWRGLRCLSLEFRGFCVDTSDIVDIATSMQEVPNVFELWMDFRAMYKQVPDRIYEGREMSIRRWMEANSAYTKFRDLEKSVCRWDLAAFQTLRNQVHMDIHQLVTTWKGEVASTAEKVWGASSGEE